MMNLSSSEILRRAKDTYEEGGSALLSIGLAAIGSRGGTDALRFWRQAGRDFDDAISLAEKEEEK